jgi:deoxyribodipyrimidine photo-lyase
MVQAERIQKLNDKSVRKGRYVLYWMQASQRAAGNHALQRAVARADELALPVVAAFGLMDDYPEANERHYAFMLEGLAETAAALEKRGIRLVLRRGAPADVALRLADDAAVLIADRGYLHHQRKWRRQVGRRAPCRVEQVESDAVVPVRAVSDKQEYAARTLRPKQEALWETYLVPLEEAEPMRDSLDLRLKGEEIDVDALLPALRLDRSVRRTGHFVGGLSQARTRLRQFIADKLARYADERNDPSLDIQSHMSPYLHFGQISPLEVALAVRDADAPAKAKDAYLEELLIRRELAVNYCFHQPKYDSYQALPGWARATLRKHRDDARPVVYTLRQLEAAETYDPYWNAAMREMLVTGKIHNYMRMYWGKKIIEWTRRPRTAFRWMLGLNNRYFLDGRDPASYANVSWCFGLHDRPWAERDVFGTVRYMSAGGLERKFDIAAYVRWAESL